MKYILALLLAIATPVHATNYLQAPAPRQHAALAPVSVSVTTSSTVAIAANISQTSLECTNIGTATVFLAYGSNTAIVNGGTAIAAGATWWMDDYLFTTQGINVIGSSATTLACQEFN